MFLLITGRSSSTREHVALGAHQLGRLGEQREAACRSLEPWKPGLRGRGPLSPIPSPKLTADRRPHIEDSSLIQGPSPLP